MAQRKKTTASKAKKTKPAKKQAQQASAPQKILITSALPYVNNVPHLGNIIGCVLSADVFARFCRSTGHETLYICGTDEHGTATETKALEEGVTPKQICDKYYAIHKQIYEWFGCSFDCTLGRTSTDTHTKITQDIFLKLNKNGYITKKHVEQLFCEHCKKFLADRFIEGSCPHCNYSRARGDQCESCGKLLNATELKNPTCKVCTSKPIIKTSEHLFVNLAKLQPKLAAWVKKQSIDGFWSSNAITVTNAWLKEGLKERCITRDLTWGVPVPLKGFEKKVFYVWFDAPIGYPSITAHEFAKQNKPANEWKNWWQAHDVHLYQFMAKDNIPFHTILFPGSLIGTGDDWNLLHHISSTEYLNYEDGKFSKSSGSGVFGDDAMSTGVPPDVWRYYLLTNRPETQDTQFNWNDFQEKNNHELLANFGNFVNRTLVFLEKYFESTVPDAKLADKDRAFINHIDGEIDVLTNLLQHVKLKDAMRHFMAISKLCNQYFQENEPWTLLKKGEKTRCGTVLNICVNMVRDLAVIAEPFLPFTSREIFRQLNLKDKEPFVWDSALKQPLNKGHKINQPRPLFRKLEDPEIQGFRERFKGKSKAGAKEKKESDPLSFVDLRVAAIVDVRRHPNADKLYIEQIDLGPKKVQIISGLADYYTPEQLLGKKVVVVANLAPAKLRGEMSHGMLLAGSKESTETGGKKIVRILEAPKNSMPGDAIVVDGIESTPKRELTIDEFFKAALVVKNKKVFYGNKKLKTKSGDIAVELDTGTVG
ncbi:MAG: methionine--tRNA ligase [Candidatus Woesearchaeota archaeon]|nr:methionine--tRNA ligase [Candidatus Woesearchaeota archaeon]